MLFLLCIWFQAMIHSLDTKVFWKSSTDSVSSVTDVPVLLPWFLECNPARFPYWWGRPDPRNTVILAAMRSGA